MHILLCSLWHWTDICIDLLQKPTARAEMWKWKRSTFFVARVFWWCVAKLRTSYAFLTPWIKFTTALPPHDQSTNSSNSLIWNCRSRDTSSSVVQNCRSRDTFSSVVWNCCSRGTSKYKYNYWNMESWMDLLQCYISIYWYEKCCHIAMKETYFPSIKYVSSYFLRSFIYNIFIQIFPSCMWALWLL